VYFDFVYLPRNEVPGGVDICCPLGYRVRLSARFDQVPGVLFDGLDHGMQTVGARGGEVTAQPDGFDKVGLSVEDLPG
jgi:hypothetical protein